MNQPLVSIILPVYNAKEHLARCIESIRAQTYQNIEIIIVNDGSTDRVSYPICEMYQKVDPRILLVDKANAGVAITRNRGIEQAAGKYVQFVDSDDYLEPDFTEALVAKAEETGADMVLSHYYMEIPCAILPGQELKPLQELSERVRSLAERAAPETEADCGPEVRVYGFLKEGLLDKNSFALHLLDKPAAFYYGVMWNKLYRRALLLEHGIRCSSELAWSEDFLFNLEYIRYAETFYAVEKPGYHYVQNPQSICHSKINVPGILQTKALLFTYYRELYEGLGLYEENKAAIYRYLVDVAESTQPTGPLEKLWDESKEAARTMWANLDADEGSYAPPAPLREEERLDRAAKAREERLKAAEQRRRQWEERNARLLEAMPPARRARLEKRAEKKRERQTRRAAARAARRPRLPEKP